MKNTALVLLSIIGLAGSLSAGPFVAQPVAPPTAVVPSTLFRDTEYFFDLYGSYLNRYHSSDCGCDETKRHGWGGGISVGNYFIPNVGLRADANFSSVDAARSQVCADFLFRYLIPGSHFAPYALIGGGIESANDAHDWMIRVGGGLEYRVTPRFGLFTEASYAWIYNDEKSEDLTVKLGVRFIF
ncbi:MAG: outer membrane beta-barrel protein [Verrucomicrobiaceae bacterium]